MNRFSIGIKIYFSSLLFEWKPFKLKETIKVHFYNVVLEVSSLVELKRSAEPVLPDGLDLSVRKCVKIIIIPK